MAWGKGKGQKFDCNIPQKFRVDISSRSVLRRGRSRGILIGDMEERVIPDVMNDIFLTQGRYPENFVLISQLEVCQEGGGQEVGDLEDVEGS